MSWKSRQLNCNASGQRFSSYSFAGHAPEPDGEHRTACPVCGKTVKLMQHSKRFTSRDRIPFHHAAQAAAKGASEQ